MGTRGPQLVVASMSGTISSNGTIVFNLVVSPDNSASYKFGPVQYTGQGTKAP
jgi:hypothetical protein